MAIRREPIDVAFFARLQATMADLEVQTWSRKYLHWKDCDKQPAVLFVGQADIGKSTRPDVPPIWVLDRSVIIYARQTEDPEMPGSAVINDFIDAIEKACEFVLGQDVPVAAAGALPYYTTLGGLVATAYIAGEVKRFEAHPDQLVVEAPIQIELPGRKELPARQG